MKWKKTKLGDVLVNYDNLRKPLSSIERQNFQGFYPYYGAQGIIDHVREYRCDGEYMLIAEDGENLSSRNEPIAQIVKGKFWVNNHAHIARTNEFADLRFLCYILNYSDISGYVTGSAQPKLSQGNLNKITLNLPPLSTQRRIASILSAYDNLIENNSRRIKLLERMAEGLYKEWFVRFRFPGHENVEMENGLPKGWKVEKLGDYANIIMGQSPESQYYNENKEGLPFHQGVGSYGDFYLKDEIYSSQGKRIAEPNSIIFSVRAPVGRINLTLNKIILGRGVASINSKDNKNGFLLWLLKEKFAKEDSIGGGSIFTSVTKEELFKQKITIPSEELLARFNEIANNIEMQIRNITKQSALLTRQRDLLLPRLMSGKLEVE